MLWPHAPRPEFPPSPFKASFEGLAAEDSDAWDGDWETRSNISDEGVFVWNSWDRVGILAGDQFRPFDLVGGAGSGEASFSGPLPEGVQMQDMAIYPHGTHTYASGAVTVNYPSEYTYQTDTTDTCPVMLALSSSDNLEFKHVGGVIRIRYRNVPVKATHIRFTFPNQQVTGDFALDMSAATPVAALTPGSSTVTIYFTSPTEKTNTRHFYIPVPTGEIKGIKIDYLDADDQLISGTHFESDATLTINRRTLLRMPGLVLTVINAGIE